MLAVPIYSLQVLDRVLSSFSIETLVVLCLIVSLILIFMTILQIIRNFALAKIAYFLEEKIDPLLLDKTIEDSIEKNNIGAGYMRDLNTIKSFISSPALISLLDAPWAIIYFLVIFFIHPINGFITVIGAIIIFFMAYLNERIANKKIKKINERQNVFYYHSSALSNVAESIVAMGMKKRLITRTIAEKQKAKEENMISQKYSFYFSNISKTVRMIIQMITMASGAILVINNKMSAGGIIATSILAGKALAPFDALNNIWGQLLNAKNSYKKINDLIDEEPEEEKTKLPEISGELSIEKITYKLANSQKYIIKGINISIKAGESVAIIGATGSGKTTLAKLLAGIIKPSSGSILLDGARLEDYDNEILGDYIGYLAQASEFMLGTVKENIARMASEIDDKMVVEAAKITNNHQLILKLEKAYETVLDNKGSVLSAGQKQRLALTRCFYGNPKILILDEPNSNLDMMGDLSLKNALLAAKQKKITSLIISHRPNILEIVDKILFIENGEAKVFGEKNEVLEKMKNKKINENI